MTFRQHLGLLRDEAIEERLEVEIVGVPAEQGHGEMGVRIHEPRHEDAVMGVDGAIDSGCDLLPRWNHLDDGVVVEHHSAGEHPISCVDRDDRGVDDGDRGHRGGPMA